MDKDITNAILSYEDPYTNNFSSNFEHAFDHCQKELKQKKYEDDENAYENHENAYENERFEIIKGILNEYFLNEYVRGSPSSD